MNLASGRSLGTVCILYSILTCRVDQTLCQNISDVNNARTTVLTGYNKHTRPTNTQANPIYIHVLLSLIAIRDFDEVAGKLSTGILFQISWKDDSLVWDSNMYNGVSELTFSQDDVWKPLLTLSNPYDELKELGDRNWMTILAQETGEMNWSPLAIIDTTCSIDTKFYPFDSQTCFMEMYPFGLSDTELLINVTRSTLDLQYYEGHGLWEITSTSVGHIQRVSAGLTPLFITISLKRQPTFMIVNFLIPMLSLAILNPLAFVLPTDSGERIGFSITILLSLSVFMTVLENYIPPNANPMSLCAYMLMALYICSSVILMLVIISIKVYFTSKKTPVNSFSKGLVKFCSFQFLNLKGTKVRQAKESRPANDDKSSTINENGHLEMLDNNSTGDMISWQDVSRAIDKFCMVVIYMIIFATLGAFIGVLRS